MPSLKEQTLAAARKGIELRNRRVVDADTAMARADAKFAQRIRRTLRSLPKRVETIASELGCDVDIMNVFVDNIEEDEINGSHGLPIPGTYAESLFRRLEVEGLSPYIVYPRHCSQETSVYLSVYLGNI